MDTTTRRPSTLTRLSSVISTDSGSFEDDFVETFGNYFITRTTLGTGCNQVKLGYHSETGDRVAAKIVRWKRMHDEEQETSVRREIEALRLLSHPHIISLLDVIETVGETVLILPYYAGGDLLSLIGSLGRLSETRTRHYTQHIVSALQWMHERNVVHRDLKPDNILLDEMRLNVVLCDFGFCHPNSSSKKQLNTFCGTQEYASPEMLMGEAYDGECSEAWSLGVLLFFMACGHAPFSAGQLTERLQALIAAQYTIPDHVSPDLRALLAGLLVPTPSARLTLSAVHKHPFISNPSSPDDEDPCALAIPAKEVVSRARSSASSSFASLFDKHTVTHQ